MPRRWLYRAFESRLAPPVLRAGAAGLALASGSDAEGWLSAFDRRWVRSGWPGHGTNWINLHASRLLVRARQGLRKVPPPPPRVGPRDAPRLRVGLIGRFIGLLGFPPSLFASCPANVAPVIFDVSHHGRRAEYLSRLVDEYHPVDLHDARTIQAAASAITDADLDLLVNINWKADAYDLLDRVRTRCVANYCVGSDLLHHPRVDIELLWQLQAANEIRHHRVYCTDTNWPVGDAFVYQISGLYDSRGLGAEPLRSWHDRAPLIVSHGSLYKFVVPEFLHCMLDLLAGDAALNWALAGKDNGSALNGIMTAACTRGVDRQVRYEGAFSAMRNDDGEIDDPAWVRVQELLRQARLAPDPFPIGSGSARFEAYMLGAPSAHMGIHGRQSRPLASCDLPVLAVSAATGETVDEYVAICRRCLSDPAFAATIQSAQLAAAERGADAGRWWRELVDAYGAWSAEVAAA